MCIMQLAINCFKRVLLVYDKGHLIRQRALRGGTYQGFNFFLPLFYISTFTTTNQIHLKWVQPFLLTAWNKSSHLVFE